MKLWSAICLASLAFAAPAEPNGAGTLEAREPGPKCRFPYLSKVGGIHKREPRVLMPGEKPLPVCPSKTPEQGGDALGGRERGPKCRFPYLSKVGGIHKREPRVLMPGEKPLPVCPSKTPERSEDALEKREPSNLPPGYAGSCRGSRCKAARIPPGKMPKRSEDALEKREPRRSGRKPPGTRKIFRDEIVIPAYGTGPQRRDIVDEQAAEVEKRFVSISKPLHGIAPAYRRIRTWAVGHEF